MKKASLLFGVLLTAGFAHAQQQDAVPFTPTQQAFYNHLLSKDATRRAAVQQYLRTHPGAKESYTNEKGIFHLYDITADGKPVYRGTRSNLQLATSVKTTRLRTGGGLGLTLDGQNSVISASASRLGLWEPSPVRTTHQEFGGRAITRDVPAFTTPDGNTDHATHVAGTMIAAGVDPNAKGMAPTATLSCYEAQTDELAEMLAAGVGGMLLSNHSYGPAFTLPVAQRGYYSPECVEYDSIVRSAPNYLPVVAAGNDRDDANGITYDIIIGTALSKNVMSVAAVNLLGAGGYTGPSSVVMSDFSSYGPADDGRVKPDISAPGVQIYSSFSGTDAAYSTIDGTSMASPGTTGSLYLLQQYNRAAHQNQSLRASTLKGLALHTADEAGAADGPDYSFGWGLLNMEKAVNRLRDNTGIYLVTEQTLSSGTPYRKAITTPGGAFKATICWTDPVGTPIPGNPLNDATPSLVNDLDLRIIDANTNTPVAGAMPWMLDPANPTAAATRGDNVVDNVEQIWVANLPAGNYFLQVTNKGNLAGTTQDFALLADGLSPTASNASVSIAASANPACAGASVTFTATPTNASSPTYQWTRNGANIAGANAATYTSSALANGDMIACRMTSGGTPSTSNTITLTVTARPAAFNITTLSGATTFCQGGSVTLAANAAANASFPNYQWSNNGTPINGATSASYVATAAGNYTVTMSNAAGCGRTSVARTITVNPAPAISISAAQNPFCASGNTTLSVAPAPTTQGNTYRWMMGNTVLPSTVPQTNATAAGNYTVRLTYANGCVSTSPVFTLNSYGPPAFSVTAFSNTTICQGGSVNLAPYITVATAAAYPNYQWANNGVNINGATSITYTAMAAGNYTVAISDANGCSRSSIARTVTVNTSATAPAATITPLGSTSIGAGGSVTLQANAGAGLTYQWFMDNVPMSGNTGRIITVTTGGSYTVRVTSGACSNQSAAVVVTETQNKESRGVTSGGSGSVLDDYFSFSAFPNPADNKVTVRTNGAVSEKATVQVMSLTGAAVKEVEMQNGQSEIDLSGVASGVYLLRYKDVEGRTGIIRLVKQ